ncbi:serine/threonine protein kinase [Longimicrobium sp.]|uniref:serine/threonine protein kinase n=1 Tax=Longimicrobium sp. TaxID=2029185 RepID=UPI003B3AD9B7
MRHRLFGFLVEADLPIPGLATVDEDAEPRVRIWMGSVPADVFQPGAAEEEWYVSPRTTADEAPTVVVHRLGGGAFRLRYADGCEYHVNAAGTRIACTWPAHFTVEDAATYLLGPVFGLVLRLRGIPSLHASAVAVDGVAVALAGAAGTGKSTTAAALAARGHALLADDVLALRTEADGIVAQPAYPHLRLWPDIVPALLGPGAELPPLTPNWDKRGLRLDEAFHPHPLPLGAVYVLCGREPGPHAPRLEPMSAMDAMLALVANGYVGWFPDRAAQARELEVLGLVGRTVPVAWATPSADPARLGELCGMIEADVRGRRG